MSATMTNTAQAPDRPEAGDSPKPEPLGWALPTWLCIFLLLSAWTVYRLAMTIEDLVSHSDPRWDDQLYWALPTMIGTTLIGMLGAAALLLRRRIGLHLILAVTVAGLVVGVVVGVPLKSLALSLIGVAVTVVLVSRKWQVLK